MSEHRPEVGAGVADVDLSGRTVLVTGSTSGLGEETALALARLGATVLVHGRDRERGREVVDRLHDAGAADAAFYRGDFADFGAVEKMATRIEDDYDELDVLVNNAGGYFTGSRTTADGVELTIAINHLSPFLLTNRLLPLLRAAGTGGEPSRVVTVASIAHRAGKIHFDRFTDPGHIGGWTAYSQSKLANVLFTRELARRLDAADAPVLANCCHPGIIPGSGFTRDLPPLLGGLADAAGQLPVPGIDTPAEAAETQVYLAATPGLDVSGRYFANCRERRPATRGRDDRTARKLWEFSRELTGIEASTLPTPES